MKIRQGFVSNSSSSSYIIYGILPNREDCILISNENPDRDDLHFTEEGIVGLVIQDDFEDSIISIELDDLITKTKEADDFLRSCLGDDLMGYDPKLYIGSFYG